MHLQPFSKTKSLEMARKAQLRIIFPLLSFYEMRHYYAIVYDKAIRYCYCVFFLQVFFFWDTYVKTDKVFCKILFKNSIKFIVYYKEEG